MQILSKSSQTDFTDAPRIKYGKGLSFSDIKKSFDTEVGDSVTVSGDIVYEVATITLNKGDIQGWKYTLEGLPAEDAKGNTYYYWVKEVEINGEPVSDYTASYQFIDGDEEIFYSINAKKSGNGIITIRNTPDTTPPPEGADLPTSGGSGTAPYRTAGFLLMMTAVTFPYIKHRNRRKRNGA